MKFVYLGDHDKLLIIISSFFNVEQKKKTSTKSPPAPANKTHTKSLKVTLKVSSKWKGAQPSGSVAISQALKELKPNKVRTALFIVQKATRTLGTS